GASGVLINITGGMDLAIDEVTTISSIIQEAAGEEAEIIFGAVHDSALQEEVRVTVIATGFDRTATAFGGRDNVLRPDFGRRQDARSAPRPAAQQPGAQAGGSNDAPRPLHQSSEARPIERKPASDLEIPTFIRRQMD
ncbi:MAG TPA: hypothetical protein VFZ18_06575, partial [Longimicrobiaceae bacterium]